MSAVRLNKVPSGDDARERYDRLIGIDEQKRQLAGILCGVLAPDRLARWLDKHHPGGLGAIRHLAHRGSLVVLAGEVGCGKTELATTVGGVIAEIIDRKVVTVETPSDIRGGGLVGELSARVTAAFSSARTEIGSNAGILVIDEGDDLGTSRAQMQAHHEDRAGLNVLIKEVDRIARDKAPLAVLLVTNRLAALDAALVRRARVITFQRPNDEARRKVLESLLGGIAHSAKDLESLLKVSKKSPAMTFSDLLVRAGESAILAAQRDDKPLSVEILRTALENTEPSPLLDP